MFLPTGHCLVISLAPASRLSPLENLQVFYSPTTNDQHVDHNVLVKQYLVFTDSYSSKGTIFDCSLYFILGDYFQSHPVLDLREHSRCVQSSGLWYIQHSTN